MMNHIERRLREAMSARYPADSWLRMDIEALLEIEHDWPHEVELREKLIAVLDALLSEGR